MKRKVKLYGVLRKHFGREYELDVNSTRDAIQALCNMVPGFEKFLTTGEERGLVFTVFSGTRNLSADDLDMMGDDAGDIRSPRSFRAASRPGCSPPSSALCSSWLATSPSVPPPPMAWR